MRLQAQLGDGRLEGVEHAEVAAARAPVRIGLALEVLDRQRRPLRLRDQRRPRLAHGRFGHRRLPRGDTIQWCPPKGYTLISCTGTYFFVFPASTSRTPATTPVSERRYRANWPL